MSSALPANLPAERALVASALAYPQILDEFSHVDEEAFHHPCHVLIWQVMRELRASGAPVDPATVGGELQQRGKGPQLRAFAPEPSPQAITIALLALSSEATIPQAAEHHAKLVLGAAALRRLVLLGAELQANAREPDADPEQVIEQSLSALSGLAIDASPPGEVHICDVLRQVHSEIEARFEGKQDRGIATGFADLDEAIGPLLAGHLDVVAGRPGTGKTALAMEIARRQRSPVLVLSAEMYATSLGERLIAAEGEIEGWRIQRGRLTARDWLALTRASSYLSTAPIWIADFADMDLPRIRSTARRWRARRTKPGEPALIIVDYVQLIGDGQKDRRHNREQEVARVSRGLKAMAKELRVPVLALAQINRGVEAREKDKRPRVSDLRESGQLEQDADLVMLLYRDELYNPATKDRGVVEVIIGKGRHVELATVKLRFRPGLTRFDDLSPAQSVAHWSEQTTNVIDCE